jgi:LPXTG-motif cell wall-anchored protein
LIKPFEFNYLSTPGTGLWGSKGFIYMLALGVTLALLALAVFLLNRKKKVALNVSVS